MLDESYISYASKLTDRLPALEKEMSDPAVASDHRKFRKLVQEHGGLKRIQERVDTLRRIRKDTGDNEAILADTSADPEFKKLAEEELPGLRAKLEKAEQSLVTALIPPDPTDRRGAIMEIRAGTGGDEAALFAADLYRMYAKYCESKGWKVSPIDASTSNLGGYKEIVFSVEGDSVYGTLKYESGGHRVQRVPATEAQGRIHTSAATVAVFPEADEEDEIELKPDEIRIDIFCSSGPGGQSVNTTYSAVRVTHLPTGIVAQCQDERSQQRNKAKAMKVLTARILDTRRQQELEKMQKEKRSMIGSGDRNARIRTYNFPQNRLTDHRVNFTIYSLDKVIEGDLQEMMDTMQRNDAEDKIKNLHAK